MPFITVAIPTYRRLPMLRRAVQSVFAQTFSDWEMVISDDEALPGESWEFLEALAASDQRVRPVRNGSPHGACSAHNTALKAARGEWIKILHDDDVLKPKCLEVLAHVVRERPDVIAISCACEQFVDGKLAKPFRRRDRPVLEHMDPRNALLAMYILDESGWALPTQQMVHRSVIDGGVLFEKAPGINTLYDSWFNARVRARGETLVYNLPLVEWHQGQHETTTSAITDDQLTLEFLAFRRLVLSLMPNDRDTPSLKSAEGMVSIIRAFTDLRKARFLPAIRIFTQVWDPRAYIMTIRWLLRQYYPRRFSSVGRTAIWRSEGDMERISVGSAPIAEKDPPVKGEPSEGVIRRAPRSGSLPSQQT
jgi:glycosyltransferase involved in cell wall biosynthesis